MNHHWSCKAPSYSPVCVRCGTIITMPGLTNLPVTALLPCPGVVGMYRWREQGTGGFRVLRRR